MWITFCSMWIIKFLRMTLRYYNHTMKDPVSSFVSMIGGVFGGGLTTTLLSINLNNLWGLLYFCLTCFFGGLIGFFAKKFGDYLWKKLTKIKPPSNEASD